MTQPALQGTHGVTAPGDYRHYIDYAAYRAAGGYQALQHCVAGRVDAHALLHCVERAEAGEPSPRLLVDGHAARVMGVAIGTGTGDAAAEFTRLQHDPHRLLEGLLITAWLNDHRAMHIVLHGPAGAACRELLAHEIDQLVTELPIADLPRLHLCDADDPAVADTDVGSLPLRTLFRLRGLVGSTPSAHPSPIVDGLHQLV